MKNAVVWFGKSVLARGRVFASTLLRGRFRHGGGFYCASRFWVSRGVDVVVGDHCYVGHHAHFGTNVMIGDGVLVASAVSFVGGDHAVDGASVRVCDNGPGERRGVMISDGAWIGHGAILLDGVTVGEGAIVGAGAVVTRDVPDFAVVGGNPARVIRLRECSAK